MQAANGIAGGAGDTITEFAAGQASFIIDSTDTLYSDPNGAEAGYVVVADLGGATIANTDILVG